MKLQAGLLHLDGHALCWEDCRLAIGCVRSLKADIKDELIHGALLMSYCGDRITEEEDGEIQPLRCGPYIITFDGRLDNRDELFNKTGTSASKAVSDPELVLKAYERFGDAVLSSLVGEFALVLWCDLTRSLRMARSACGARNLYYTLLKDTLYWASDVRILIKLSPVDLKVNDKSAIEYLLMQNSFTETAFQDIHLAPPNRALIFREGLRDSHELWDPTQVSPLPFSTDAEYEERLRSLVKAAVQQRMRSKATVFSELSGGLDSSTVVLTGDGILRDRGEDPNRLQTVSCVYDQSATCDERKFIAMVEDRRGIQSQRVTEEEQRFSTGLEDSPEFTGVPNPLHCLPGRYVTKAKLMRDYGARVLLTGLGGDHLFWSDVNASPIVADELFRGHLLDAHKECKLWSRHSTVPYYELFFRRALPQAKDALVRRCSSFGSQIPVWLHPTRRKCVMASSVFERFPSWRAFPSQRAQVSVLEHLFRITGSGLFTEYADIYLTHPYSYRPLVEFCLGTPIRQFLRNGETRSLMRRAFRDQLPAKIVNRVSKGLVDESMVKTLEQEWPRVVGDVRRWEVCQRDYVDSDCLLKAMNEARLGILDEAGPLFRLFSLERWLRSLAKVPRGIKAEVS